MYGDTHMRQLDVLSEEAIKTPIALIGVGGIGSNTAYLLTKMGFSDLLLVDPDEVEEHNLSTQFFMEEDIGVPKVQALLLNLLTLTNGNKPSVEILPFNDTHVRDIVISGVDSMESRQEIWDILKKTDGWNWYIEARMGLEMTRVYCVNKYDEKAIKLYETTLYPADEATEEPCTARSIGYNTFFIASLIGSLTRKIVMDESVPVEIIGNIGSFNLISREV